MGTTTVYFVRHGEISNPQNIYYGRSFDFPLTPEGEQDIYQLAFKLREQKIKFDAIYSSPLLRTRTTARILAEILGTPETYVEDDLNDVNIPALVGKPLSLRDKIHSKGADEYSEKYLREGNESRNDIVNRMYQAFEKIRKNELGKTICLVSHGDPLRFLLYRLLSKRKTIPSANILTKIYYPPKGGGWRMSFDAKGKVLNLQLLPLGEVFRIKY